MNDIEIENHGSLFLFRPVTDAGREWLEENVPPGDEMQYMGEALVVEPRFAAELAQAMIDAGLKVA